MPEATSVDPTHQLRQYGVSETDIYRDVGISGIMGTSSRRGWRDLDFKLVSGEVLVEVAIGYIIPCRMETANAVQDLRASEVNQVSAPVRGYLGDLPS